MATDFVIIVAGGSGTRLESDIPKQFLRIGDLPILMHTILAFFNARIGVEIIVVLPKVHFEYWLGLCEKYKFTTTHRLVEGGASRFQSVKNGLNVLPDAGVVAIHDGVRPFVPHSVINHAFEIAILFGNAIAVVPSKDSLRVKNGKSTMSVDRTEYFSVQTPQVFKLDIIKNAFGVPEQPFFTDDASVLEYAGGEINLVEGSYQNIKITTKEDLIFAEGLLTAVR
jgi:2-C-methyl-D-erythritol 4-phosphate cytidylyltransferase